MSEPTPGADCWRLREVASRIDLSALRAFIVVAEAGSFRGAADRSGLARSSLVRQVELLEDAAGQPLMERTKRGLILNSAGERIASGAREMLAETSALLRSVRDVGHSVAGLVRLALPVGLHTRLISDWLTALWSQHPEVRVHLLQTFDPLRMLQRGADAALHFGEGPDGGSWVSQEVWAVKRRVAATEGYLAARGTPTSVDDLTAHVLAISSASMVSSWTWPLLDGGTIAVTPAVVTTDPNFVRSFVAAGKGIGLVFVTGDPSPYVHVLADEVGDTQVLRFTLAEGLLSSRRFRVLTDHAQQISGRAETGV